MSGKRLFTLAMSFAGVLLLFAFVSTAEAGLKHSLTPVEELGKLIFFDQNLSVNQNQACAVCHGPSVGWTGPNEDFNIHGAVYEGSIPGSFGARKPPASAYATFSPIFHYSLRGGGMFVGGNFWDGRATGMTLGEPAAEQALGPFLNPKEQALPDSACVVYKVCQAYLTQFEEVWGTGACSIEWPADVETTCATPSTPDIPVTVTLSDADRAKSNIDYDYIGLSIASYEGSPEVSAFTSKFDYALKGLAHMTKQEQLGYDLFQGKAKCSGCHISSGSQALFTDFTYDNLGIPKNPDNPVYAYDPGFIDLGLGGYLVTQPQFAQYAEANNGKFKVPTLRNVDLRPSHDFVKAYGHNGYFKSLEEIVHFYNTRDTLKRCEEVKNPKPGKNCWPAPEYSATINTTELGNLGLTDREEGAIVAFLKTLSDGFTPHNFWQFP